VWRLSLSPRERLAIKRAINLTLIGLKYFPNLFVFLIHYYAAYCTNTSIILHNFANFTRYVPSRNYGRCKKKRKKFMKMQTFSRASMSSSTTGSTPGDAISGIIVGVALSATSSEKRQLWKDSRRPGSRFAFFISRPGIASRDISWSDWYASLDNRAAPRRAGNMKSKTRNLFG